jgi:hypothetical protein
LIIPQSFSVHAKMLSSKVSAPIPLSKSTSSECIQASSLRTPRRSQFDRGTTMAELDEYEFDRYDHHESLPLGLS